MQKLILRIAKYYWTFVSSRFFLRNRPDDSPKRILITKFDKLGDFFLLIPFLQQLVKQDFEIVLISPVIHKEIIDHLAIPVTFIPFNKSSIKDFAGLLKFVRNTSFSHSLNLSMNIWGGFLVNQSKSRQKIGLLQELEHYVYKGANLFYDKSLSYPTDTHNFEVLRRVFEEVSESVEFSPCIEAKSLDDGWIVIHPFASWQPRQWPRYFDLIDMLVSREYKIRVIGTQKEYQSIVIPEKIRCCPSVSFEILSSVGELLNQIEQCRAFIGNDSGPAHYAALIGKPTTVIWGPGFFERIHPKGKNVNFCISPVNCRPCRQKGKSCMAGNNSCLQNISVDMVMEIFENSMKVASQPELIN